MGNQAGGGGELVIEVALEVGVEEAKERVPESVTRVASEGVFSFTLLIKFQPWTSSGYDMQRHNKTAGYKKSVNSILPVRLLGPRKTFSENRQNNDAHAKGKYMHP